jgi:outer membrane protein assembly factor BamB
MTPALVAAALFLSAAPADWSRFRGPNGSGVSDTTGLPTDFGPSQNVMWKVDLPEGFSSPVIAGGRIFLTGFRDDALLTLALDRATGKLLWEKKAPRDRKEKLDPRNHPAAASAATDGERVFVFFGDY